MAEIGYIALVIAFVASVYSIIAFIFGARWGRSLLVASARKSVFIVCGLVSVAVAVMFYALVTHNFQIEYVASYTSTDLSLPYLISAIWVGSAGSLLFWSWLLSIFAAVVVLKRKTSDGELLPYASAVIMLTEVFFLTLLIFVKNPFHKLAFVPVEGLGLNPLFENIGMILHPPILLVGYVGFTIPFAFAIAALLAKRLDNEWIIAVRRWTLLSWLMLGAGILIGAWWAYTEAGQGSYWSWDPVENTSLMPWLAGTAFLHSIMMQRRKGMLKAWNMVLIILTFSLTIFGTFLTRSNMISFTGTFSESAFGPFFLGFLTVIFFGSLLLLFYRRHELKGRLQIESLVSREGTFLLNNLLLVGATLAIFVGTVFLVLSGAARGIETSPGTPFFNQVNVPIFLAIILLAGVCTLIGWRRASARNLSRHFLRPLVAALVLGLGLFLLGVKEWYALVAFILCGFVLFTILIEWFRGTRARHRTRGDNYLRAFGGLIWANRPRYGGYIVHIAVILIAIGIIGSSAYNVEEEAALMPGEQMAINDYTLVYEGLEYHPALGKMVFTATLSVYNHDKLIDELTPTKYFHRSFNQAVNEAAIRFTPTEDLYIILAGWGEDGTTAFKVLVYPMVIWIWIGGGLMILGGVIAFWPEGRRLPRPNKRTAGEETESSRN